MSRVAIDLNFIQIYWYSIFILIGMMIGMYLVYSETKKKKISENLVTNLIFYTVIIAIFGARIYYVLFNWDYYSKNFLEIFELWNGGLAIHGGIIFGGLFLIYYTKAHKLDTLKVLDICSVGLIIGQAFGRWGNFFNQEAYGAEVSLEFLKGLHLPDFIIDGMHINGTYWHPTFLYESLWCLIGLVILLIIRRRKYIKTGQIFAIYCMWYGFGRFFIEALRTDSLMLGPIKAAQVVSIGMFLVGVFFFVRRLRCPRFDHLYNDADVVVEKEEKEDKKYYGLFKNYNDDGSYKNKKEEQNNNSNINSGVIVGNTSSNVESGGVMNLNMNVETPSNPEPVQSKTFIDTGASQSNQLVNNNNFPNMNTQPVINNNVDYNNTYVNNGMNNNNFVNNNINNNVNTNVNNPFINNGNNNNM